MENGRAGVKTKTDQLKNRSLGHRRADLLLCLMGTGPAPSDAHSLAWGCVGNDPACQTTRHVLGPVGGDMMEMEGPVKICLG